MARYFIARRLNALGEARAESIEDAAQHWARRVHGRRASTMRTTGTKGMSGYFQAYVPLRNQGLTSIGAAFHVQ